MVVGEGEEGGRLQREQEGREQLQLQGREQAWLKRASRCCHQEVFPIKASDGNNEIVLVIDPSGNPCRFPSKLQGGRVVILSPVFDPRSFFSLGVKDIPWDSRPIQWCETCEHSSATRSTGSCMRGPKERGSDPY